MALISSASQAPPPAAAVPEPTPCHSAAAPKSGAKSPAPKSRTAKSPARKTDATLQEEPWTPPCSAAPPPSRCTGTLSHSPLPRCTFPSHELPVAANTLPAHAPSSPPRSLLPGGPPAGRPPLSSLSPARGCLLSVPRRGRQVSRPAGRPSASRNPDSNPPRSFTQPNTRSPAGNRRGGPPAHPPGHRILATSPAKR